MVTGVGVGNGNQVPGAGITSVGTVVAPRALAKIGTLAEDVSKTPRRATV